MRHHRRLVGLAPLVFVLALAPQGGGPIQQGAVSPRMQRLQADVGRGVPGAVDAFWRDVSRDHTPIVESVPGDPAHVIVTLLWRGAPGTTAVAGSNMDLRQIATTDVWFVTFQMDADHRFWYIFDATVAGRTLSRQSDPLNPYRVVPPPDEERPASAVKSDARVINSSILVLPTAPLSPWTIQRTDVPRGRVVEHSLTSALYDHPRRLWVYTPPGSSSDRPASGVLICFWGADYLNEIPAPTILDNLVAAGRLPALAAIFVDDDNDRFQSFETTRRFTQMLSDELIPWARTHVPARVEASRTIVTGYSAGGLESGYAALTHPDLFGNVLTSSGAFWRAFEGEGASAPEWVASQFAVARPPHVTRFFLDAGGAEQQRPGGAGPTFVEANRHLRDVLVSKGYPVEYREVPGGEHDFLHWRSALPDGLIWLTSAWPH